MGKSETKTAATMGMTGTADSTGRFLGLLYLVGAGLIAVMVAIGGLTRLSGSGLSIVDWSFWSGILPPLNGQDWMQLFERYQTSPQYRLEGLGMTLGDFQDIFWLEYIHRLWGRGLGLYYGVLCVLVWIRPEGRSFRPQGSILLALIIAQGIVGWYMVKSGLSQDPRVSPYRLSLHLILGFGTCLLSVVYGFRLRYHRGRSGKPESASKINLSTTLSQTSSHLPYKGWIHVCYGLLTATVLYGAFVAGHRAGLLYPTFPLMGGRFFPEDGLGMAPIYLNFVENPATIQWVHRLLAVITAGTVMATCLKILNATPSKATHTWCRIGIGVTIIQLMLGIGTLTLGVPMVIAVLHQLGALALMVSLTIIPLTAEGR